MPVSSFAKIMKTSELVSRYAVGQRDFRNLNLMAANLRNLNLSGANFSGANLSKANLTNANLANANLTDTILVGANLTGVNLTNAKLTNAKLDEDYLHLTLDCINAAEPEPMATEAIADLLAEPTPEMAD